MLSNQALIYTVASTKSIIINSLVSSVTSGMVDGLGESVVGPRWHTAAVLGTPPHGDTDPLLLDKHTNFAWEHTQVCRH